jgi:ubiquinone biosynthesis monooxygenase Coq7
MRPEFSFDRTRPGPRRDRLAEMLRVDHAGEFGAVQIYRGQLAVFGAAPSRRGISETLREMEAGEAAHLEAFDRLLRERSVRPTAFSPLWRAAGYGLGVATALMGEKAAMAATEAVEDVIERHYAEQALELDATEPKLAEMVREFREDELDHKQTAEAAGAEDAPGYRVLKALISAGCRMAIKLSEKI